MNLHQASKKPEWETVAPEERNLWQRAAARTKGIASLANAATAAGLGLTVSGVNDVENGQATRGFLKMLAGGSSDKLDGYLAERYGLKSHLGEIIDNGSDKLGIGYSLIALTRAGVIPPAEGTLLGVQNGANIVISAIAKKNDIELHSSLVGKVAVGMQRAGIGIHVLAEALRENDREAAAQYWDDGARVVTGVALALGTFGTIGYAIKTFHGAPAELPLPDHPEV